MQRRRAEITHNLLVFAMQRTIAFENSLSKIATGITILAEQEQFKKETNLADGDGVTSNHQSSNPFKDVNVQVKGLLLI